MGIKAAWDGLLGRQSVVREVIHHHDSDHKARTVTTGPGKTKYGNIKYQYASSVDYDQLRENGRGVYQDSLTARGIVNRLVDNVINTGLTWEASPLWKMIPGAVSWDDERRYAWTENVENLFTIYSDSKEADYRGRLTLRQIQRLLYLLRVKEGEYFAILRYVNDPKRTSPLTIQILNNDQVQSPLDIETLSAAKSRGATIEDGIEYDKSGKMSAIYVKEDMADWSKKLTRIPAYGPRSGRRFIIHDANFESADQYRGFPELSAFVYELDRLTEYDIAELEATVANALWVAAIETEKDATPKGNLLKPAGGDRTDDQTGEVKEGIERVELGSKALFMQNLGPGQKIHMFQPTRPNQNYEAFVEAFESRMAGAIGMPLSAYRLNFQASYSAARAEILFFWNSIMRRRDDFASGFLNPFYEAWFSEAVRSQDVEAPGFDRPKTHRAWLYGSWNGISRPVVDPVKEVNAVEKRQRLGHTTGEKEAKAYNGSDFRENVQRLKAENELISEANTPLDPAQYEPIEDTPNPEDGGNV